MCKFWQKTPKAACVYLYSTFEMESVCFCFVFVFFFVLFHVPPTSICMSPRFHASQFGNPSWSILYAPTGLEPVAVAAPFGTNDRVTYCRRVKERNPVACCSRCGFCFHPPSVSTISAQLKTPKLLCAAWLLLTHGLALPLVWLWQVMFTGTRGHQVKMPSALFTPSIMSTELPETLAFSLCYNKSRWNAGFTQYYIQ